jgi:uncharacterized membrane protein
MPESLKNAKNTAQTQVIKLLVEVDYTLSLEKNNSYKPILGKLDKPFSIKPAIFFFVLMSMVQNSHSKSTRNRCKRL